MSWKRIMHKLKKEWLRRMNDVEEANDKNLLQD